MSIGRPCNLPLWAGTLGELHASVTLDPIGGNVSGIIYLVSGWKRGQAHERIQVPSAKFQGMPRRRDGDADRH